jgi:hypothetical protein
MHGFDVGPVGQQRRALQHVAQLAHVARERVLLQPGQRAGRQCHAPLWRHPRQQGHGQQRDVVDPVAQRWQRDREGAQR